MKQISVAIGVFLISSQAFAKSQIVSDFELSLPRHFQQTLIDRKWESLVNREFTGNWQFSDQQVQTSNAPVYFKGVSLKLNTFLQKPALGEAQGVLHLTSKGMQAELSFGSVSVDHVVERTVGGVTGRFRIQALCENVVLQLMPGQGIFSVDLAPAIGSSAARMDVRDVRLSWAPGSWKAREIQCRGTEGFADLLKSEIARIANDSQSFVGPRTELIKQYIQDSLQAVKLDFSEPRELVTGRKDIQVVMKVSEYADLKEDGVRIKGQLHIDFQRSPEMDIKVLSLGPSSVSTTTDAQLRLPKDFIKEVMGRAYAGDSWQQRVYSDKIPGFSSLMRSRFVQFFVWPELMRFSKATRFIFDMSSHKDIGIQGEGLYYQMNAPLLAKMWAPRGGAYVPFMNFTLPFTSQVQLSVNKGTVSAQFKNSTLGLSPQWDSTYLNDFNPSKRFSGKTIRDRILQGLDGKTVTVPLPPIPVMDGVALKVQKLLAPKGEDLVLKLAP